VVLTSNLALLSDHFSVWLCETRVFFVPAYRHRFRMPVGIKSMDATLVETLTTVWLRCYNTYRWKVHIDTDIHAHIHTPDTHTHTHTHKFNVGIRQKKKFVLVLICKTSVCRYMCV
jgi:hypothetical protein